MLLGILLTLLACGVVFPALVSPSKEFLSSLNANFSLLEKGYVFAQPVPDLVSLVAR